MRYRGYPILGFVLAFVSLAGATSASAGSTSAAAEPISTKVTERVTKSAVDAFLESLNDPHNKRRLGQILSSRAVTRGVHAIAFALTDGMMAGVSSRAPLDQPTKAFWENFDARVRQHVGPAASTLTRRSVDAAMTSALSDDNAIRAEAFAAHVAHGAMKGVAQGMRDELGPALASPEMQLAIATTMNSIATNLVRGGDAGFETAKAKNAAEGNSGMFELFSKRVAWGAGLALSITIALALAIVVPLTILLIRSNRRERRLRDEGKRRENELLTFVEQLDDSASFDKSTLRERLLRLQITSPSTEQRAS